MKVIIKGAKIILSTVPMQNVEGALLILSSKSKEYFVIDVTRNKKEYDLPEGVAKKDVVALYLRIM